MFAFTRIAVFEHRNINPIPDPFDLRWDEKLFVSRPLAKKIFALVDHLLFMYAFLIVYGKTLSDSALRLIKWQKQEYDRPTSK